MADPKVGTGKKPKNTGRRLYTCLLYTSPSPRDLG